MTFFQRNSNEENIPFEKILVHKSDKLFEGLQRLCLRTFSDTRVIPNFWKSENLLERYLGNEKSEEHVTI